MTIKNRRLKAVVDVMKVPMDGDPSSAIVIVGDDIPDSEESCDVLVVGGGMGGVAAAWIAARRGHNVCLLEETDWLGGQITSQGVAALDEHEHIESFGGTRSYYQLCETIREHYRKLYREAKFDEPLNPGRCWVSRLAFEPEVAVNAVDKLLESEVAEGRLRVLLRTKAVGAEMDGDQVVSVTAINLDDGCSLRIIFQYVLDATELGDLLPLTGTEYVVGAECVEETSEPHAQPKEAMLHCMQSCTYPFVMEKRHEYENNHIARPRKYEHYRDLQPYSLRIHVHGGEIYGETTGWLDYQVFDETEGTKGPLWQYRRLLDADQFPTYVGYDLTLFNWPGNDYRDVPLVDQSPEKMARALQDAKQVSLGFAYWLQKEVPNRGGASGFANLLLRPDVMGTQDGLSKYPYIRESRRIKAIKTIVEQELTTTHQVGSRAAYFHASVGVGWYPIDIHQVSEDEVGVSTRTKPFQIPLGALLPKRVKNLIAANKNIGTTHITNGCYRLHPVEWNIGEAAGLVVAFALEQDKEPRVIQKNPSLLRSFQYALLAEGGPLNWLIEVPVESGAFEAIQRMVLEYGHWEKDDSLCFKPDSPLTTEAQESWIRDADKEIGVTLVGEKNLNRREFARRLLDLGLI